MMNKSGHLAALVATCFGAATVICGVPLIAWIFLPTEASVCIGMIFGIAAVVSTALIINHFA